MMTPSAGSGLPLCSARSDVLALSPAPASPSPRHSQGTREPAGESAILEGSRWPGALPPASYRPAPFTHTSVMDPVLGSLMACLTSHASEWGGMGAGWAQSQAEGPPDPEGWGVGWMIRVGSEKGQKETGVLSASSHDLEWDTARL